MILENSNICLALTIDNNGRVIGRLSTPGVEYKSKQDIIFPFVNIHVSGDDTNEHHGRSHLGSESGYALKYVDHILSKDAVSQTLSVRMLGNSLAVTAFARLYNDTQVIQFWTCVENVNSVPVRLEYVSSLALWNINQNVTHWDRDLLLHLPTNFWSGETNWISRDLSDHGFPKIAECSMGRISVESTGTWSSCGHVPFAVLENCENGQSLFWQIEHNGSWHWEIGDQHEQLFLLVSGPTENENGWSKVLASGETFTTVTVAAGVAREGLNGAISAATDYRRAIIRPCEDNRKLPVIFNDYMNCLVGEPTTEKLLPLIDKAHETGCEIFCIDCGWYADGYWWDNVGAWEPSTNRFPNGIMEPINYIREKGMVPGLWIEIEVMGVNCPLVESWPKEAFFIRHGKKVKDRKRYQLDFRHPKVIAHANSIFDKMIAEYGVGYIKIDYNINAGTGTEVDANSFGDGLLQHNLAYLAWLDALQVKYPDLIIENCGSGGMRLDYALLKRCSVQSVSDQTDYRLNTNIAASCATCLLPEQSAIWSYPLPSATKEEVITNMINSMLLRIHQSGYLNTLEQSLVDLVSEGISTYKTYRQDIPAMHPIWPLGLPNSKSGWLAFGLESKDRILIAVWRKDGEDNTCLLPFPQHRVKSIRCIYPEEHGGYQLSHTSNSMTVTYERQFMSRLFEITL
ncbi:glycoside hydrolase family 36 protein [Aeromonas sp. MdU4]|uniref:glycoside hydrolase family 36 protein n=1 Tax=Aeromonas sp. MdU4 TaxID=3342819 RepID=UPI0035BB8A3F